MSPSPEQEPAVHARGRDVVVSAGAGAGKTRTLVARYLSLLGEGLPLRSIVAITFTRKAAREMRNRVRAEMREYLERLDLAEAERRKWQVLYTQLDAARIGTMHGLCTEILRAHPAEAGVDPRFEVLSEGQGSILRGRAVEEALAWAADDPKAVTLFPLLGERGLRGTLAWLISRRLDAAQCFAHLPDPLWPVWRALLVPAMRGFVDDRTVRLRFDRLRALRADGSIGRAEGLGDKLVAPLRRLLALWDEIIAYREEDDWAAISARLAPLRKEMKQVGRAANWGPSNPKPIVGELQGKYDQELAELVGEGINLALDRQLAGAMPGLRRLFEKVVATYQQAKRARNALDFDDLESGALTLLEGSRAVRQHWQEVVRAILVDELQDTNGRQLGLVDCLNGKRGRLFAVGDAKQSIYRFRGADVTVFRALQERVGAEGGDAFCLQTSYRAHRDLIRGLNDLLRPVLGEGPDPDRPWATPFAPLKHHREEPGPGFEAPHIELHLSVGTKAAGALGRAADAVAARIAELVEDGVQVEEGGQVRPLGYGDVAILCRASSSFGPYEDALERAGVRFLTVAGRGFYDRAEIRDLLNALHALSDPTDDLALVGLLRSPAFGLSDEALYGLCAERDRADDSLSLWDVLGRAEGPAEGQERVRARRAAGVIAGIHDRVGRSTVADVLKAFLDAADYRAALIRAGQARGARNVAKLLKDAQTSGVVGVEEFLEYVSLLRGAGAREGEARTLAEGAVQIMSVHAAKGLEFPVVIIGDAGSGRPARSTALLDRELGLLLPLPDDNDALPAIHRLGRRTADDQESAESDRLLYVGATRAREKLIVSGCVSLKKDGTPRRMGGFLGRLAGGLGLEGKRIPYDEDGQSVIALSLQVGQTSVSCTIYEPGYVWDEYPRISGVEAEPPLVLPPPLLEPVVAGKREVSQSVLDRERIPPQRVWRVVPPVQRPRAPAWVIGKMVHEALAAWRFPGDDPATGSRSRFEEWARARAREHGITDSRQLNDAIRQTRRLLTRFRAHPLYGRMDAADTRLHEVPYSLPPDGRIERGIIDALYLRDGVWTIVEFKTDAVKDRSSLRRLLNEEDYLDQARRYVAAVATLLDQRPACVLCFLNLAGTVHLHHMDDDPGVPT